MRQEITIAANDSGRLWTDDVERWNALCSPEGCIACQNEGLPSRMHLLGETPMVEVISAESVPLPGYVFVASKKHAVESFDLSVEDQRWFWTDAMLVARGVADVLRPTKMNYEIHGNTIPHLHMHLFPRTAGDGSKKLTTIASTADEFNFFGFDTSISNSGEVAFKAELDEEFGFDEGLFSGSGTRSGVTTHYLASTSAFDGSDARPSINNSGDIVFVESIDSARGIFVGQEGEFTQIAAADPTVGLGVPISNNAGTVVFQRSFFDEATQQFVEEIVKIDADGTSTVVADTRGEFSSFGFRPPSLNDAGDVAFLATLDDFSTSGIFVGPDPVADRVISTGDQLDGATVKNITFCEEGLSDSGELAFVAQLDAPETPDGFRTAVFRATPTP